MASHDGSGRRFKKLFLLVALLSPIVYLSTCTYISGERERAFDSVRIGDTKESVLKQFGKPSVSEKKEAPFLRYSSIACSEPCEERLWFENAMTFGVEAWSIELGTDHRVVHKAHWASP
jgi:hypothetical protein